MFAVICSYDNCYMVLLFAQLDTKPNENDYTFLNSFVAETMQEVKDILKLNNVIESVLIPFMYELKEANDTRNDE